MAQVYFHRGTFNMLDLTQDFGCGIAWFMERHLLRGGGCGVVWLLGRPSVLLHPVGS